VIQSGQASVTLGQSLGRGGRGLRGGKGGGVGGLRMSQVNVHSETAETMGFFHGFSISQTVRQDQRLLPFVISIDIAKVKSNYL